MKTRNLLFTLLLLPTVLANRQRTQHAEEEAVEAMLRSGRLDSRYRSVRGCWPSNIDGRKFFGLSDFPELLPEQSREVIGPCH